MMVSRPAYPVLIVGPGSGAFIPESPRITVGTTDGKRVKFSYSGVEPGLGNPPNFIVLAPAVGVTPQTIQFGLNPLVAGNLQPGRTYSLGVVFTTVDEDPVQTDRAVVRYTAPIKPRPSLQSVVNTASLQPYFSPGAMISIFGSDLAAPTLTGNYDETASYPLTLGNTSVTIGGLQAPLLYVSPEQINAILPYGLAGTNSPEAVVTHFGIPSLPMKVSPLDTSPAIFTATQTGTGQALIRQLGPDRITFSYNTLDNPAPPGTAFELTCTGAGIWNPPVFGDIHFGSFPRFQTYPISVTIGGLPARVIYAGPPGGQLPWSRLQINVIVPEGAASGPQPLVIKVGPNDSSRQQVTIAIQ